MTHLSLVNIRNLAIKDGITPIAEISDTFEIFPSRINRWEDSFLPAIRAELIAIKYKHVDLVYDYLMILDMNNAEFMKKHNVW